MKALIVGLFGSRSAAGRAFSTDMLRATIAALLVAALAADTSGQGFLLQGTRIIAVPLQPATAAAASDGTPTAPAAPAAAEPSAPAAATVDPATARIAKIKQLVFDRRPSVLLGGTSPDGAAAAGP